MKRETFVASGLTALALWGAAAGAAGCASPPLEEHGAEALGATEQPLAAAACPQTMDGYADQLERAVFCTCGPVGGDGDVYGTDRYAVESSLCRAAVHAGAIDAAGGPIRATVKPPSSCVGSTRFGIASQSRSELAASFVVDGMDTGAPVVQRWVPLAFYGTPGAQTATSAAAVWRTSFAVHNPAAVAQVITVKAYDDAGQAYRRLPLSVPAGGATSFQLDAGTPQGGDLPAGFRGAVLLEGSRTFEVTAVHVPVASAVANRPIANAAARTSRALHFPRVVRGTAGRSTRIYLRNTRAASNALRLVFRDAGGAVRCERSRLLGPRQGAAYDLAAPAGELATCTFPSAWEGTLTVETETSLGRFTGAALQVDAAGTRVSAYEGVEVLPGDAGPSFPAAQRSFSGTSTAVDLQNLGGAQAFAMQYTHRDTGALHQDAGSLPDRGAVRETAAAAGLAAGFIGSADFLGAPAAAVSTTARDDGAPDFEGVVPGLYTSAGMGVRLSLPYVRWSAANTGNAWPRSYIAVQNLSGSDAQVRVTYVRADGSTAGVHALAIPVGRKASSTPADAGIAELGYAPGYGASAIVESLSGWQLLGAVVRTSGTTTAEDYTGIPIPATAPELIWPNQTSVANSDPWLRANHQAIRQLRPKVLLLNFVNGFTGSLGAFQQVAHAYRVATRYHEATDPSALPFVDLQLAKLVDLTDAAPPPNWPFENSTKFPRTSATAPHGPVDYARFFGPQLAAHYGYPNGAGGYLGLCDLIDRGLVHELWFVASQDVPDSVPQEALELKQRYDAADVRIPGSFDRCAGNGCFAASVPVCGRSVRIAFINYKRGIGCFLESLGHSFEGMAMNGSLPHLRTYFRELAMYDLDTRYGAPFDSWYKCVAGQSCLAYSNIGASSMRVDWWIDPPDGPPISGAIEPYTPVCGNAHFPPNGRRHYDTSNPQDVPSTCAHYRMKDGPGGADRIELYSTQSLAPFEALAPQCTGSWQVYWRQQFPGLDNAAKQDGGAAMRNWWPYLYY